MKSDTAFFNDLDCSRSVVQKLVDDLRANGLHAEIPEHTDRPDNSVRMQYADSGDFFVCGRVEHKIRKLHFTCLEDFPFPTVIIDEQYKVDARSDAFLAYIIENRTGTCAVVVYNWQRPQWRVERLFDSVAGRFGNFYTIDKKLVRFCRPQDALILSTTGVT